MYKHYLSGMLLALWVGTACGNENPVDTLPSTEPPAAKTPETQLSIEPSEQSQSLQVTRVLNTVITPQGYGISGVKAIPFREVGEIFAPYANKSITIGDLIKLSKKATDLYQKKGYPLSFVYIPVQDFKARMIRVVAVEGHVSAIKIEGNPGGSEAKIREIAGHLLNEKPLTLATMERYTTMLGLLPGLKISASLPLPKRADGSTELLLNVRRKPIDAIGRLEQIDPVTRGIVTVKSTGNTPFAEELAFSTLISKQNEDFYALAYSQPVGMEGMILRVEASSYDGRPVTNLGPNIERQVTSLKLSTSLSYPFILKRNQTLIGTASLTANNFDDEIRNKQTGNRLVSTSDVRTVAVGVTYARRSSQVLQRLQLTMSRGLESLGASKRIETNFPANGLVSPIDLNFSKFVVNFVQRNYLEAGWGTTFSIQGQYSPDYLPVTERVLFGGFQYGRAFRPGRIVGDSGWGLGFEINRTIPFNFKIPFFDVNRLQPYVLFEAARIYENVRTDAEDEIRSGTVGLRLITDTPDRSNIDLSVSKSVSGGNGRDFFEDVGFGLNFGLPFN